MFAKMFETLRHGQIVVMKRQGPRGEPEIRAFAEPKGLGVCEFAVRYKDDDSGWDLCERKFQEIGEADAVLLADQIFKSVGQ